MPRTRPEPLALTEPDARRLAVSRQHLAGPVPPATASNVRSVLRSLRYLQLDPVNTVARSHEVVLWSRLGRDTRQHLADLLWRDRWLFEYWTIGAAIVLTEDYPLYRAAMDAFATGPHPLGRRMPGWVAANQRLREHILHRIEEQGQVPTSHFDDCATVPWQSTGWTTGRSVERMLEFLLLAGEVMVAGRSGRQRLWALPHACLPPDTDRTAPPLPQALTAACEHSIRALGVAREVDVGEYFLPIQQPLSDLIRQLVERGRIIPAQLIGAASETWYVHTSSLPELARIRQGDWQPRTTLLSPFDNLISHRDRTRRLWGFSYRNEMYVPKQKRQYGYYVMPILHGDQLVGRVCPRVDRRRGVLRVEGLYLEPTVPATTSLRRAVTAQIDDLATFAGAATVEYGDRVPEQWRASLSAGSRGSPGRDRQGG